MTPQNQLIEITKHKYTFWTIHRTKTIRRTKWNFQNGEMVRKVRVVFMNIISSHISYWHKLKWKKPEDFDLPASHRRPVQPGEHKHVYAFTPSTQVPNWQSEPGRHSSISASGKTNTASNVIRTPRLWWCQRCGDVVISRMFTSTSSHLQYISKPGIYPQYNKHLENTCLAKASITSCFRAYRVGNRWKDCTWTLHRMPFQRTPLVSSALAIHNSQYYHSYLYHNLGLWNLPHSYKCM